MHTKYLNFAKKSNAVNIVDTTAKDILLHKLSETYGEVIPRKSSKNFEENDIQKLQNTAHCVSLKTQGNPYFLLLTKMNFTNTSIFIDKKVRGEGGHCYPRMIISHLQFSSELYDKELLLEGEMIKTYDNDWIFVINDIIGLNGNRFNKTNLPKRLQIVYDILENKFQPDNDIDPAIFQIKKYCTYDYIHDLVYTFAPTLPYRTEGIIFKALHLAQKEIVYTFEKEQNNTTQQGGKNENTIKQDLRSALSESNTIEKRQTLSVKATDMPDLYYIYSNKNFLGYACIPSKKISFLLQETFSQKKFAKIDMICEYNDFFKGWIPISTSV